MLQHIVVEDKSDARILVGMETHDDAGVFQWDETHALVQTIDFFTPVVDDPEIFGRIAAVNALSDIYAMGGVPMTALNLLAIPAGELEPEVVARMLEGGRRVLEDHHTALLGGHSIDDPEPKMGYQVTGMVHPEHIWRNSTAQAGDVLWLTKPVGTGVVIKALKDGVLSAEALQEATSMMVTSNAASADAVRSLGDPGSCTDVTGFGLLGHAWEMAGAAGVSVRVVGREVPILAGASSHARAGRFPAGSRRNLDYVRPHLDDRLGDPLLTAMLSDAVTSGGLLFTFPEARAREVTEAFRARGLALYRIGRIEEGPSRIILE